MPSLDFSHAWPWLQWVITVTVVLGLIAGVIRGLPPVWRFVSGLVNTGNELADLPAELRAQRQFRDDTRRTQAEQIAMFQEQNKTLAQQNIEIAVIKKQLFPNGGSTLRDDVVVIKSKLETDNRRLNKLEGKKDES